MDNNTKSRGEQLIPHHFKPGKSGFEGRKHQYANQRNLVKELNPLAVEVLRHAMLYGTPKEKIVSAKVVLEFGLGKPAQEMPTIDQEKPKGISMVINGVKWEVPPFKNEDDEIIDAEMNDDV